MITREGERMRLVSWGRGLAYELTDKAAGLSVFLQGGIALRFEMDLDTAESAFADADADELLGWLWDQCDYGAAAEPVEVQAC